MPQYTNEQYAKLKFIARKLNENPETRTPEGMKAFVRAIGVRLAIEKGLMPLPEPSPEPLVPEEIANARRYLDDFGEYCFGYTPTLFHLEWEAALADPKIDRLLIIAPPDHGKSQVVAIQYPAWLIGRDPAIHVGLLSNTATQAQKRSVAVRDTLTQNTKFQLVFPNIKPDFGKGWSEAEWFVKRPDVSDKDSTFKASGIYGPITGDRYDVLIFDDPDDLENTSTALQREKMWNWIDITALTRVVPGGKAVAIQTRYHHEDTAARLTQRGWHVITMPALEYKPDPELVQRQRAGDTSVTLEQLNESVRERALWESRWSAAALQQKRAEAPLTFERVYQGRPTPQKGALIQESWWRYYDPADTERLLTLARAEHLRDRRSARIIQVLDTASKIKTMNDFSVIATWALYEGFAYLINIFRDKLQYPQLKQAAKTQYERFMPHAVIIESASSGIQLFQELQQTTTMPVYEVQADRDKVARLNAVIDYIASGRVYLPQQAPWLGEFLSECADFPLGAHDDIVDTVSLGLSELFIPKTGPKWATPAFLALNSGIEETRTRVRHKLSEMIAS